MFHIFLNFIQMIYNINICISSKTWRTITCPTSRGFLPATWRTMWIRMFVTRRWQTGMLCEDTLPRIMSLLNIVPRLQSLRSSYPGLFRVLNLFCYYQCNTIPIVLHYTILLVEKQVYQLFQFCHFCKLFPFRHKTSKKALSL